MNDKIVAYIRQYRDIYTREAITARLVKAGYNEADINTAFEHLETEPDKPKLIVIDEPRRELEQDFDEVLGVNKRKNDARSWWDSGWLGFLVFVIGAPLAVGLMTNYSSALIFFGVSGVLLLGLLLPKTLEKEYPHFADGIRYAFRTLILLFVVLPFLDIVVIFGICLVDIFGIQPPFS
jgi:hypothetical protein